VVPLLQPLAAPAIDCVSRVRGIGSPPTESASTARSEGSEAWTSKAGSVETDSVMRGPASSSSLKNQNDTAPSGAPGSLKASQ